MAVDFYIEDYGTIITFTLQQDSVAHDLTGATVTLTFQKPNGDTVTKTATVSAPATAGLATYTIEQYLLDVAGLCGCKISIDKAGSHLHGRTTFSVGK